MPLSDQGTHEVTDFALGDLHIDEIADQITTHLAETSLDPTGLSR
ncbi:hypothetical protein ACUN22_30770 [Streptomyces anulatus]